MTLAQFSTAIFLVSRRRSAKLWSSCSLVLTSRNFNGDLNALCAASIGCGKGRTLILTKFVSELCDCVRESSARCEINVRLF